jgi:hypothetical protein
MNDKLKNALLVVVGITSILSLAMLLVFLKPSVIVNNAFPSQVSQSSNGSLAGAPGNMLAENYDPYIMYNGGFNTNKDMTVGGTFTGVAATLTGTLTGVAANFTGTITGVAANFSGALTATTATFSGLLKGDAGYLLSYTNSTSTTATTQTLVAADILNYTSVIMTPNVADVTFTFPASSTLSALVPAAGDRFSQCWYNASTTSGIDMIFAAGTGIDLKVATSTVNYGGAMDLTIGPEDVGCLEYIRKPATASAFDIIVGLIEYNDAD